MRMNAYGIYLTCFFWIWIVFEFWTLKGVTRNFVLSLEGRNLLVDGGVIGFYIPEPSCML